MSKCKSIGCNCETFNQNDFCASCNVREEKVSMSSKYPKYFKDVADIEEVDVYAIHKLFDIQDPSGCIQHASKKLLLSGARTGGKSAYKDISEAKDTLERWLQLNASLNTFVSAQSLRSPENVI